MKKIWKQWMVMGMLLCMCFMLTGVPVSAKKVSTSSVKQAGKSSTYKKAMKAYKKLLKKINGGEFAVVDIDNDKVPELMVRGDFKYKDPYRDYFFALFYYYKGKVYMECGDWTGVTWIDKIYKRGDVFKYVNIKMDGYYYCKLDKKKHQLVFAAAYCGNDNFRYGKKKEYYINEKKVSKKAFNKYEKKINKRGEQKVVYRSNTTKNRTRYLK